MADVTGFVKYRCPYCGKESNPKAETMRLPNADGSVLPATCIYCSVCGAVLSAVPIPHAVVPRAEKQ